MSRPEAEGGSDEEREDELPTVVTLSKGDLTEEEFRELCDNTAKTKGNFGYIPKFSIVRGWGPEIDEKRVSCCRGCVCSRCIGCTFLTSQTCAAETAEEMEARLQWTSAH